jgi:hypothetical protein
MKDIATQANEKKEQSSKAEKLLLTCLVKLVSSALCEIEGTVLLANLRIIWPWCAMRQRASPLAKHGREHNVITRIPSSMRFSIF